MTNLASRSLGLALGALCLLASACSSDSVSSDEQARRAYLGLDASIGKAITLGFQGFNAATNANIDPQSTAGDAAGTLTVTGQVDQGSSANKGMRLYVAMVGYSDGVVHVDNDDIDITYDTSTDVAAQPYLEMKLNNIPTGTLAGSLMGDFQMTGDLKGDVTLNLTFTGTLMSGPNNTVVRAPGTTTVTGTAVSGDGTYDVMVTI